MSELFGSIDEIVKAYEYYMRDVDSQARNSEDGRAYGGILRASKGTLVETIAESLVHIAWVNVSGNYDRLDTSGHRISYTSSQGDTYSFKPDVLVKVDDDVVMAIECKAYTENAMYKRILTDAKITKDAYANAEYVLFQLESQLGGDYSSLTHEPTGSSSTRALNSLFDVDIKIITLLEGERKVDEPIHDPRFYKPLTEDSLEYALSYFEGVLGVYV